MDDRVFLTLGILKIGAILEREGVTVDHIDLSGVVNYEEAIRDYPHRDAVFAITSTTPQIPAAIRIRDILKEWSPNKVILGGPHATMVNAAAKRGNGRARGALDNLLSLFDCVVSGEGEKSVFTAIYSNGLVDGDDPKSEFWNNSKDFTDSPWPARHLSAVESYHYEIDGRKSLSLVGQLSCSFKCNFCGGRNSPTFRQIRKRPPESIVDEMIHLHDTYGTTGAMFYDDELNINKSVIDLMKGIIATGIDWRLRGFVKAELFTEEQAELMYAAGFRWLLCGFESAHPKILKNINKIATREDNTRMLRIAHKYGIKVKALMSIGHPGESPETINATRDWLLEERPDDFDATLMTLYPGTPYWDDSVCIGEPMYRYEVNGDALYSENVDYTKELAYYKGHSGKYHSFVWTDYIDREHIVTLRDNLEREVRSKLGIPYPTAGEVIAFEHSMGLSLPPSILRSTK